MLAMVPALSFASDSGQVNRKPRAGPASEAWITLPGALLVTAAIAQRAYRQSDKAGPGGDYRTVRSQEMLQHNKHSHPP